MSSLFVLLHLLPYVEIIGLNGVSKSLNGFQGFSPLNETVKTTEGEDITVPPKWNKIRLNIWKRGNIFSTRFFFLPYSFHVWAFHLFQYIFTFMFLIYGAVLRMCSGISLPEKTSCFVASQQCICLNLIYIFYQANQMSSTISSLFLALFQDTYNGIGC